jgi:hypothetical protein
LYNAVNEMTVEILPVENSRQICRDDIFSVSTMNQPTMNFFWVGLNNHCHRDVRIQTNF